MGKRKHLTMEISEFFAAATLVIGRPTSSALAYSAASDRFARGVTAWTQHTEKGREWAEFVANCGEAKSRAGRFYVWYLRWYNYDERLREHYIKRIKKGYPGGPQ